MKKSILYIACALTCILFSTGVDAQVVGPGPGCSGTVNIVNNSGDDWVISYYNNDLTVDAGNTDVLGFTNVDITTGRGVLWDGNVNDCNHKFQANPDFWLAACAPNTSTVSYFANETSPGCFSSGVIIIQP